MNNFKKHLGAEVINESADAKALRSTFNYSLGAIGGQTTNFLNADQLDKIFKGNPDLVSDPEIQKLAKEVEDMRSDFMKVQEEWVKKGRALREKIKGVLSEKSGEKVY